MNASTWVTVMGACISLVLAGCGHLAQCSHDRETKVPPSHPALAMQPVPDGLGVNIHFYDGNENDLRLLDEAGIGTVRMDVDWSGSEKQAGTYDFSRCDRLIRTIEQRGIRLLFILDYGNPLYDDGLAPHSEPCRAAYARFCAALAARYTGKPVIWELWNEPNIDFWKPKPNVDDYMTWCKAVVPAIRAADPHACIIGPATSGVPISFLRACFERGLLELVDGVSIHPYRAPRLSPETAIGDYAQLAALIDEYRPKDRKHAIPIISGEWGYTSADLSVEEQGKYLARQWLTNLTYGIPISIWYDWHDDGQDPAEREHHFGTVTWDYQPKPAYTAMKALIAELRGYAPKGRLQVGGKDDYVAVFERAGDCKLVLWTTGAPHEVDLGPGLAFTRATDYLGGVQPAPQSTAITIDKAPRYLTVSPPVPGLLRDVQPCRLEGGAG